MKLKMGSATTHPAIYKYGSENVAREAYSCDSIKFQENSALPKFRFSKSATFVILCVLYYPIAVCLGVMVLSGGKSEMSSTLVYFIQNIHTFNINS